MEDRIHSALQHGPLKQRVVREAAVHEGEPVAQTEFRKDPGPRDFIPAEPDDPGSVLAKTPREPATQEAGAACHKNVTLPPNCARRNHCRSAMIRISLKLTYRPRIPVNVLNGRLTRSSRNRETWLRPLSGTKTISSGWRIALRKPMTGPGCPPAALNTGMARRLPSSPRRMMVVSADFADRRKPPA